MALLIAATAAFTGSAQAAPGGGKKTFSNYTGTPIPDATTVPGGGGFPGWTDSFIAVSGLTGDITNVTASFHILHNRISDLDVAVVSPYSPGPDPLYSYFFSPMTDSGDNFGTGCADGDRTTFDDAAAADITSGSAPFVGTFRPQDSLALPLSVFDGLTAAQAEGNWSLSILDSLNGGAGTVECWSLMIETTSGSVRFDSNTQVTINDAEPGPDTIEAGEATSAINVSGMTGALTEVTVGLWITHPNDSDLDITLIAPNNREIALTRAVGGSGDNFGKGCQPGKMTTFDESANKPITQGSAPFEGSFRPHQTFVPLYGLTGALLNGEWKLRVNDNVETNVGTLNCWSITLKSGAAAGAALSVKPSMSWPRPLPGAFNYPYFTVRNDGPDAATDVTLTAILPNQLSSITEAPIYFPDCEVTGSLLTCHFDEIAAGATAIGGAQAKFGKKAKRVCLEGTASATGVDPVTSKACFTSSAYPKGDKGTGYDIGDIAHNFTLQDQDGNTVSLSDFKGKYVLLQWSSVWCAPSQYEVPIDRDEVQAMNDADTMGLEVVYLQVLLDGPTVNKPSTKQNAINWVNHFDLTTPVLWTANDVDKVAEQQHLTYTLTEGQPENAVPVSVFLDPDQRIFHVRVGAGAPGDTTDTFESQLP